MEEEKIKSVFDELLSRKSERKSLSQSDRIGLGKALVSCLYAFSREKQVLCSLFQRLKDYVEAELGQLSDVALCFEDG